MSLTTRISKIKIDSPSAIQGAVADLNARGIKCELKENEKARAYFKKQKGMENPADYCLVLDDCPYDVGFYKEDRYYEIRCDLHAGKIGSKLGNAQAKKQIEARNYQTGLDDHLALFVQLYNTNKIEEVYYNEGLEVSRETDENGEIHLEIVGF